MASGGEPACLIFKTVADPIGFSPAANRQERKLGRVLAREAGGAGAGGAMMHGLRGP
jgi:hypothetical protein